MNDAARYLRRAAALVLLVGPLSLLHSELTTAYYVVLVATILVIIGLSILIVRGDVQLSPRIVMAVGSLLIVLILFRPSVLRRQRDLYAAYTGVVVRRGFEMPFFGDLAWDYVVIRTPTGQEEKRYTSVWRYMDLKNDSTIQVGDSIVKERGFSKLPRTVRPAAPGGQAGATRP